MRASTLLVTFSLFALACAEATDSGAPATGSKAETKIAAAPTLEPAPETPANEGPAIAVEPEAPAADGPAAEPEAELEESSPAEPAPPAEPVDPLAPILPSGPEPGSPEADAELAELLEESTLTQEEFDAAFRSNKPKINGDQFVFGPGERTRKRPVVSVGTPSVTGSTVATSKISSLAEEHLRGFEGCLAVALSDDSDIAGKVTLVVSFDAKGKAGGTKLEGGAGLGSALRECLTTVADNWSLAAAANASVRVPLSLRSE